MRKITLLCSSLVLAFCLLFSSAARGEELLDETPLPAAEPAKPYADEIPLDTEENGGLSVFLQDDTESTSSTAALRIPLAVPGLYKVNGKWRYYENGAIAKVNGLVQKISNGKWYYVEKGKIKKVNGLVTRLSDGKRLYVKKGQPARVTGLVKGVEDGKWYYVKNGKFKKVTGLVKKYGSSKWYYVKKGKLKKITGVVPRVKDGKLFYVTKGKLDKTFRGTYVDENNVKYKVKNGKATLKAIVSPLATSRHYSKNYRLREDFTVKYVIIHHMAGRLTGESCALYFVDNEPGTSANYCIGYDGDISCSVPENYGGVTSGNPDADKQAITIEVSDIGNNDWRIPEKAQDSLARLLADIASRYPSFNGKLVYDTGDEARITKIKQGKADWDIVKGNILTHKWVSLLQRSCPEWHMFQLLPSICEKANQLLAEQ